MNPFAQKMESLKSKIIRQSFGVTPVHLTEDELNSVETEIGYLLPQSYRDFLADYGGHIQGACYPCIDNEGYKFNANINIFYGVFNSSPYKFSTSVDLLRNFRSTKGERPDDILPIGDNTGPGITCMRLSGEFAGTIYFWDRVDFYNAEDYHDLFWVCDSFEAFMEMLKSDEP